MSAVPSYLIRHYQSLRRYHQLLEARCPLDSPNLIQAFQRVSFHFLSTVAT